MRRHCPKAPFAAVSRFALVAAAASLIAACAGAVRLSDPVFTGSTANQKQIIAAQAGRNSGNRQMAGPGVIQSQPLPPPGQARGTAHAAAAPAERGSYTPPKPYAARGLPTPVGRLAHAPRQAPGVADTRPASASDPNIVPERAPKSLNQQAAELGARHGSRQTARSGERYTVQAGDTVWGISRRHNVTAEQLMAANDLRGAKIRVGQRLVIPGNDRPAESRVQMASVDPRAGADQVGHSSPSPRPRAEMDRISVPANDPASPASVDIARRQADDGPRAYVPPQTQTQAARQPSSNAVSQSGSGFRWPVRGRVISSFGKKPNGERNDGINLAVPEGTAVKAAENGVVIYAGNELKSYGNLILIKHADGWVSAYAHNSRLLVNRGDEIRRGQIVAESGMTGGVTSPQLHFELRKGATPVNPLDHLSDA